METSSHDVLLVGGGGAALRAAIAVSEINPKLSVAVVSKVYPMRSHTVSAEGGAAGVIGDDDTLDEHAYDTISGGDWLSDQDCVEIFVNEIPKELLRLEHWGCPWSRRDDGKVAVRPFGGMKKMRTWFAADKTGFHMLHTLFQTSLRYPLTRYDETFVTKLLVEDGRVCGVVAIELQDRQGPRDHGQGGDHLHRRMRPRVSRTPPTPTSAPATGWRSPTEAGAPLKDMEMVQYHPTGLPFTGILITEASRAEGGLLVNKDGYRYLQDYDLGKPQKEPVFRSMELGPRDRVSQAFVGSWRRDARSRVPTATYVHLDLRHLGEDKIDAKLPMVRELCVKYENIDPVHELIPVRPVQHYMMGGVHTDTNGATPLKGLYAAGEAACVSLNGANRLGSNSLSELLVFGARAGRAAAEYASQASMPAANPVLALGADEERRIENEYLRKTGGTEKISTLREEMQHTMEAGAGIYRDRASLVEAADKIAEMQERYKAISMEDHSLAFNTQLIAALELGFLLDVAETILQCGLQREESRGAHQRTDFPERDDKKFLAHSLVSQGTNGRPEVSYLPVTITRWPPGKRVYGERIDRWRTR